MQGIASSNIVGAFVRWKSIESEKTFEDFFFYTNFLLNAQMGVIVVGIPAFIIWFFLSDRIKTYTILTKKTPLNPYL